MDSTVLQLFTPEEILERLGGKKLSGCLHLYTARESANIFFRDGVVIAAAGGSAEGVEVLKQILARQDVHCAWQPEVTMPETALKPLHLPVRDLLAQLRAESDPARQAVASARSPVAPPGPATASAPPIYQSIGAKGKTTAPLEPLTAPALKAIPAPLADAQTPIQMTATKNINPTAQDRSLEEEALLKKHRLALVSVDNPGLRLKITRVSGLLGRNPACELPVPHPSVSRQHCLLQITERGLNLKDLGTTNGTRVNGIALSEGLVNVGDKLAFGHVAFVLEQDKE